MAQTWIGRESHHHRRAEIRSRPYFPGLLARKCWREAAKDYEQLKVNEEAERCLAAAAEVQEYWEGGAS